MVTTGIILFTMSCIPAYIGSLHYYTHRHGPGHIHIKTSKRYDDELLYHTSTALYDTVSAPPYSMERKTFFMQLKNLLRSVEARCVYYEAMVNKSDSSRDLNAYYNRRIDEFRSVMQQMPPC